MGTPRGDTSIGGEGRQFPDTTWAGISGVRSSTPERRREGLERLCRAYWKPVYRYVRVAWAKSNDDAKDLTQAFLAWLLEAEVLRRYAPEKGRFRAYLKAVLRRFVKDREEALRALKRGGAVRVLSLEDLEGAIPDPGESDPDKALDRAWALEAAGRAMARVRERFRATGRETQFSAYEMYDLAPDRPTYAEIAARLGVRENDVGNYLYAVRREMAEEIRAELAETVSDREALEEEWNELFGG